MNIPIETVKKLVHQVENTIFPKGQTKVTIPILAEDLTDFKYDNETVKTYNIYFELIDDVWHLNI